MFYGNEKIIAIAFYKVLKEFGGIVHPYKYHQTPEEFKEDYYEKRKEKGFSGEYIVDLKKFM